MSIFNNHLRPPTDSWAIEKALASLPKQAQTEIKTAALKTLGFNSEAEAKKWATNICIEYRLDAKEFIPVHTADRWGELKTKKIDWEAKLLKNLLDLKNQRDAIIRTVAEHQSTERGNEMIEWGHSMWGSLQGAWRGCWHKIKGVTGAPLFKEKEFMKITFHLFNFLSANVHLSDGKNILFCIDDDHRKNAYYLKFRDCVLGLFNQPIPQPSDFQNWRPAPTDLSEEAAQHIKSLYHVLNPNVNKKLFVPQILEAEHFTICRAVFFIVGLIDIEGNYIYEPLQIIMTRKEINTKQSPRWRYRASLEDLIASSKIAIESYKSEGRDHILLIEKGYKNALEQSQYKGWLLSKESDGLNFAGEIDLPAAVKYGEHLQPMEAVRKYVQ